MISLHSLARVAAVTLTLMLTATAADTKQDADLTNKVAEIIRETQRIKPGMTRADLLTVFTTEGGISSRTGRRYVHRSCPYIKVDVEFQPVGHEKDVLRENGTDKISRISKPFLEFSIVD